jgi:hypothetical protein
MKIILMAGARPNFMKIAPLMATDVCICARFCLAGAAAPWESGQPL